MPPVAIAWRTAADGQAAQPQQAQQKQANREQLQQHRRPVEEGQPPLNLGQDGGHQEGGLSRMMASTPCWGVITPSITFQIRSSTRGCSRWTRSAEKEEVSSLER